MPFLEVNQARLHYLEQGSGNLAVVFGHGTLISSNIWRDFYFPLLPVNWHALAPDFRGHGASNGIKAGCNFVQMAEDMAELVRLKGLGRVVYVGLSMGGGVGLQLALNHPELLKGLVLVSPVTGLGPLGNPAFVRLGPFMAGKRWLLRLGLSSVPTRKPTREALDRVVDEAMLVSVETLREYLSPTNRILGVERLGKLRLPVLLLIGARDRVIPVKQQLLLGQTLPDCRVRLDLDSGHALCAEKPDWVLKLTQEFVNEHIPL
jgi:pimeloyl-ACP methyl ester carboxylesterase